MLLLPFTLPAAKEGLSKISIDLLGNLLRTKDHNRFIMPLEAPKLFLSKDSLMKL